MESLPPLPPKVPRWIPPPPPGTPPQRTRTRTRTQVWTDEAEAKVEDQPLRALMQMESHWKDTYLLDQAPLKWMTKAYWTEQEESDWAYRETYNHLLFGGRSRVYTSLDADDLLVRKRVALGAQYWAQGIPGDLIREVALSHAIQSPWIIRVDSIGSTFALSPGDIQEEDRLHTQQLPPRAPDRVPSTTLLPPFMVDVDPETDKPVLRNALNIYLEKAKTDLFRVLHKPSDDMTGPEYQAWPTLLGLVAETAHGLACLHERGVLHRDLKTENVFVFSPAQTNYKLPSAKLADLGFAIHVDTDEKDIYTPRPFRMIGTPGYMAPEIFEKDYSGYVDVWALSVLLLEVMHSPLPYVAGDVRYGKALNMSPLWKLLDDRYTTELLKFSKARSKLRRPATQVDRDIYEERKRRGRIDVVSDWITKWINVSFRDKREAWFPQHRKDYYDWYVHNYALVKHRNRDARALSEYDAKADTFEDRDARALSEYDAKADTFEVVIRTRFREAFRDLVGIIVDGLHMIPSKRPTMREMATRLRTVWSDALLAWERRPLRTLVKRSESLVEAEQVLSWKAMVETLDQRCDLARPVPLDRQPPTGVWGLTDATLVPTEWKYRTQWILAASEHIVPTVMSWFDSRIRTPGATISIPTALQILKIEWKPIVVVATDWMVRLYPPAAWDPLVAGVLVYLAMKILYPVPIGINITDAAYRSGESETAHRTEETVLLQRTQMKLPFLPMMEDRTVDLWIMAQKQYDLSRDLPTPFGGVMAT